MKILALHLNKFTDYAQLRGMRYDEMLTVLKNPLPDPKDPKATIDAIDFYAVVDLISKHLDDELLGIRVGHHLNLNTLGAIYRISLKATTVGEALYYCQAYLQQTLPLIQVINSEIGNTAIVRYHIENDVDPTNRIILESILVVVARELEIMIGEGAEVIVYSPYWRPGYPSHWKEGASFAVQFEQTLLKAAQKNNGHWGLDILIPQYVGLVERMKSGDSFGNQVKQTILNMAKPDLPELELVANAFNQSPRTLQRRLAEEGTSYREIAEDLKRQISGLFIRQDRYSVGDISCLLGYSDSAAFIHSFKKWYGYSPTKIREKFKKQYEV